MALDDAARAALEQRREIRAGLAPADRARFDAFWRALADAPDTEGRWDVAADLMTFLNRLLPPEHPVRRALVAGGSLSHPAPAEVLSDEELRTVLAALEPDGPDISSPAGLARLAHEELLAFPSHPAERIAAANGDPFAAGLIRLPDPTGALHLPAFQFAPTGEPWPVVVTINQLLGADVDPWAVASWWLDPNAWLAQPPAELVGQGVDDRLLAAARSEREVS